MSENVTSKVPNLPLKKILLTGATGYVGKRLLPILLDKYVVYCCVRDESRFNTSLKNHPNCRVLEVDFLQKSTLSVIPKNIDAAYFLMHSMSSNAEDFKSLEIKIAENFVEAVQASQVQHVIYLSGIYDEQQQQSQHLDSRYQVGKILMNASFNTTILGAGIVIGSGSSSFEIMRDLVEKLPVMVAPRWLLTTSQFISIRNVLEYLERTLFYEPAYNQVYDIAGPEALTYRAMLLEFARCRGLKRWIIQVPFLSPRLSSYWLYFVTATSFNLAKSLVASMKVQIVAKPNTLHEQLHITLQPFEEAVELAFQKIKLENVPSSWKDSMVSGRLDTSSIKNIKVPTFGCYTDERKRSVADVNTTMEKIWAIGGRTGWYYGTWLWKWRGFLDKLFGGVGLRRGRTNEFTINAGDALDFWRVILADYEGKRLLLYAEMKLPGEAWLEFVIDDHNQLIQTATFRPRGIWGRLYWYAVMPFHSLIFNGMATRLAK